MAEPSIVTLRLCTIQSLGHSTFTRLQHSAYGERCRWKHSIVSTKLTRYIIELSKPPIIIQNIPRTYRSERELPSAKLGRGASSRCSPMSAPRLLPQPPSLQLARSSGPRFVFCSTTCSKVMTDTGEPAISDPPAQQPLVIQTFVRRDLQERREFCTSRKPASNC